MCVMRYLSLIFLLLLLEYWTISFSKVLSYVIDLDSVPVFAPDYSNNIYDVIFDLYVSSPLNFVLEFFINL